MSTWCLLLTQVTTFLCWRLGMELSFLMEDLSIWVLMHLVSMNVSWKLVHWIIWCSSILLLESQYFWWFDLCIFPLHYLLLCHFKLILSNLQMISSLKQMLKIDSFRSILIKVHAGKTINVCCKVLYQLILLLLSFHLKLCLHLLLLTYLHLSGWCHFTCLLWLVTS